MSLLSDRYGDGDDYIPSKDEAKEAASFVVPLFKAMVKEGLTESQAALLVAAMIKSGGPSGS